MSLGPLLIGAAGLGLLQAVLSTQAGAANAGGFLAGAGRLVRDFLSPQVPAFKSATASTTAASSQSVAPAVLLSSPQPAPPAVAPSGPVLVPNATPTNATLV